MSAGVVRAQGLAPSARAPVRRPATAARAEALRAQLEKDKLRIPAIPPRPSERSRDPVGVSRPKSWSPEVENEFRLQEVGWKHLDEYREAYGIPERWAATGFYAVVRSKDEGNFVYWRRERECEDKFVHRVKLFRFEETT